MKKYLIHPAVGIARVGASSGDTPDVDYYLQAEIPGAGPILPPDGNFRNNGALRRQGARFRIFEYDDSNPGQPTEVTLGGNIAVIEWSVHLANRKAFWFEFKGKTGEEGYAANHPLRNAAITNSTQRRQRLIIDFGPRTLSAPSQLIHFRRGTGGGFPETGPGDLSNGTPLRIDDLGAMRTDGSGRLTVLGGFGKAGTTGTVSLVHFANNDGWFDDTSDGPITAKIRFADGSVADAGQAWVVVGPPDFAPYTENIVTLYDVIFDVGVRFFRSSTRLFDSATGAFRDDYEPSYTDEVFPILRRAGGYAAVHRPGSSRHLWNFDALAQKPYVDGSNSVSPTDLFDMLRPPELWNQSHLDGLMPRLLGDQDNGTALTLTQTQYHIIKQWSQGRFVADWTGVPPLATTVTPAGLDRAALEACAGGGFYPGIEAGWITRRPGIYAEPFRLKPAVTTEEDLDRLPPGGLTMRSALPWQADFVKCNTAWWPAQRPDEVRVAGSTQLARWDSGASSHLAMVRLWDQLGVVKPDASGRLIQQERILP